MASEGDTRGAIATLEEMLETQPKNTKILEALAFTYLDAKDPRLAAFYFEQILQINPSMMEHRIFAAQAYADANDWNEAIRNYSLYLDRFPNDKSTWLALAAAHETKKNYSQAVESFLKAHSLSGTQPNAKSCIKISQLYHGNGNHDKVKEWLYKALKLEPSNQDALKALLKIEIKNQNYPLADKLLKTLEKQTTNPVDAHFLTAAKEKIEKWKAQVASSNAIEEAKALAKAQEAQANEDPLFAENLAAPTLDAPDEPSEPNPFEKEQESLIVDVEELKEQEIKDLKKEEPAPIPIEKKVATKENKKIDHFMFAQNAISSNNYPEAIKHYWNAVMDDPKPAPYWSALSTALLKTGDLANAEMTILEAIRRKPDSVPYQLAYLKIIEKGGSKSRWMDELENSYKKFPYDPDIVLSYAKALDHVEHNKNMAASIYKKFLEIAPYHSESNYARDRINLL